MFQNKRFLTRGVQAELPVELQLFLWNCIDQLPEERDYFQVFKLDVANGKQHIHHFSEQPEYSKEYMIDLDHAPGRRILTPNTKPYRFHSVGLFSFYGGKSNERRSKNRRNLVL